MPAPPPRAPTFPAFVDDIQTIEKVRPLDEDYPPKHPAPRADPSPLVNMADPVTAITDPPTTTPAAMSAPPLAPAPAPAAAAPASASAPVASDTTPAPVPVVPLPVAQSKSRVRAILLWRDPKLSGAVLAVFLVFFYLTLVRGNSVLSVVGILSGVYLTVGFIVVRANKPLGGKLDKYISRPQAGTPLFKRESVYRLADVLLEEGNEIGEEIRDVLYCEKTPVTIACIFASFIVYKAGQYFSLLFVLFLEVLVLFTVPLLYEKNKKQVDDALAKATDAASRQVETVGRAASEQAVKARDFAAAKSAPLLEKAPPAAKNFAEKIGLTPQKSKTQ